MITIIVNISRYVLLFLIVLFTLDTYRALRARDHEKRTIETRSQVIIMILFDLTAFAVLFIQMMDMYVIYIYGGLLIYIFFVEILYKIFYKRASFILLNIMCMLISIGLVIQTRLDVQNALKQLIIAGGATVISMFVPVIIRKVRSLAVSGWFFAILGFILLAAVFGLAAITRGSRLSIEIFGISFQLSEIVKITFVFCIAAFLYASQTFKQVMLVTVIAGIHVVLLVATKDLGAALVFFVAYIVMVCVATRKVGYAFIGIGGMMAASVVAYRLFSHVRVRVEVWKDPFADYQGTGYQIVQALFSVCAGGLFGTGLLQGSPDSIPLASKDFTFAAICEEFGILFGICLILLCMGMYLTIVNISMKLSNEFYKLVAIGLGTEYAFQTFLTIGGTTKLIPMTGITLPLISYGGSSITCTIIMIAIVEGLYLLRRDESAMEGGIPDYDDVKVEEYGYVDRRGNVVNYSDRNTRTVNQRNTAAAQPSAQQREVRRQAADTEYKGTKQYDTEELEEKIWRETEHSINR